MIFFRLLKNRLTTKLFILFIALQTSACGTEELLTAIAPDIGSNTSTDINTNSAAKISGTDTGTVIEDSDPDGNNLLEVNGKLNIADNDNDEAAFIAKTVNGKYGNLDIDATGNWHYAANNQQAVIQNLTNNAILIDSLTVSSVDGTMHIVKITISGADENSALADIHLSWVAPAEREDNSAISLSEIAGYKISYGMSQGQYPNNVIINDGTAVGYTFTDFPAGTYYFVVTTLDTEGRESQYSTEVKIII